MSTGDWLAFGGILVTLVAVFAAALAVVHRRVGAVESALVRHLEYHQTRDRGGT